MSSSTMAIDQGVRDEETPLLYAERAPVHVYQKPFPWLQFSILFALQTATFMPYFVTRPFIPDLIRSIGVAKAEKDMGYYVGLLISTLYASEAVTSFNLAQLSDKIGPRFVFLGCTIGLSVSISGFGLSTTFWNIVLCQVLIGAFRGTRGVGRSMLGQMTDSKNIAQAIAYYETSWYFSEIIGAKIGGSLSRPVEQFPRLFGSSKFLQEHPYFLPCAICSMLLLTVFLVGTIFLRETKDEFVMDEGNESARRPLSLRALLIPGIIIAAINLSSVCLLQAFYFETQVLYLSTPITDGGLGFSPRAIGTLSPISAATIGLSQLFIFPRVHDKWGSIYVFVLGLFASVPLFALWPLINWIARKDGYSTFLWFALGVQICCSVLNQFAWLAIWTFITQMYGSQAAVIGFCQMAASVLTTAAPMVSNSLFSLSIDKGYLGGYLAYFVFVSTAVVALCASSLLSRCDSNPRGQRSVEL